MAVLRSCINRTFENGQNTTLFEKLTMPLRRDVSKKSSLSSKTISTMATTLLQKPGAAVGKDDGVSVTFEDQQKINVYARKCNKLAELGEEIKTKQKELENLQDACDELDLADDDVHIPYQIGEVFVSQNLEETQALVEQAKTRTQGEIENLQQQCKDIRTTLGNLKAQLYAKFGNNINLELEDE